MISQQEWCFQHIWEAFRDPRIREMDHSNLVPLSLEGPGMDYISFPLHQLQPKQNRVNYKTNSDEQDHVRSQYLSYKILKSINTTQNSRPASSNVVDFMKPLVNFKFSNW